MSYPYRILALGLVLPVVLLTACGSSAENSPQGLEIQPTRAASDDSGPAPLTDSAAPATPALTPSPPASGERERVAQWELVGPAEDGRRLLLDVKIGGPPCDTVTGIDVEENPTRVVITVHAGRLTSADCPSGTTAALATARVVAELKQPLGDRELVTGGA